MKKIFLFLILILMTTTVMAYEESSNSNCIPPAQFAATNGCSLSESSSSIGLFYCGDYLIRGDCQGDIVSIGDRWDEDGVSQLQRVLEIGLIVLVVLLVILGLIIGFNKLNENPNKKSYWQIIKERW